MRTGLLIREDGGQGDQKILKNHPIFSKSCQNSLQAKKAKTSTTKLNLKALKHLHHIAFETLKYLQQTMFWNWLFKLKCNKFIQQKVAQNFAIYLGYFIFSKNHNQPPKVAQLAKKIAQSGHPDGGGGVRSKCSKRLPDCQITKCTYRIGCAQK